MLQREIVISFCATLILILYCYKFDVWIYILYCRLVSL